MMVNRLNIKKTFSGKLIFFKRKKR